MLISWDEVRRNCPPIRGVIHIGAHRAQERGDYLASGIQNIIWIEADPELATWLRLCVDEPVFNYAICDEDATWRDFHIASNDGVSSSLLWPKEHLFKHPNIGFGRTVLVPTITLDTLLTEKGIDIGGYNFINMDIQGAEILALHGMTKALPHIDAMYTEVNFLEMYEGCGLVDEIDDFLADYKFERRLTDDTGLGWGDALYIRGDRQARV